MSQSATQALQAHVNVVEETYEYCLAYAARGVNLQMALANDKLVRERLEKMAATLGELPGSFLALAEERGPQNGDRYRAFIEVMQRDSAAGLAAVQLVLAQPGITSQMVDNLNGMIHLRALLTDVFLLDEILRPDAAQPAHTPPAEGAERHVHEPGGAPNQAPDGGQGGGGDSR
ncbi:MAG: hypothetical protein F4018_00435 [Acidobacteria bacterium]|nr:hypothetical protein [Acidobacteriota bacterium]MYK86937.1 hypothetical protein [Acidobacteriota bacterium]